MSRSQEHTAYSLDGEWSFAYRIGPTPPKLTCITGLEHAGLKSYPCSVPGNFELDLQAVGLLDDPFYGMNMVQLKEFEYAHAWYYRTFTVDSPGDRQTAWLVFDGLDCYADIYLNGTLLGSTDNMLVEHAFCVDALLQEENELFIHFKPALEAARKYDYPPAVKAMMSNVESLYVRKAPHMYGWDIMPRALSLGIWRPVTLEFRPLERIETVYLETTQLTADHTKATQVLTFQTNLQDTAADEYTLTVEGACEDSTFSVSRAVTFTAGHLTFTVPDPKLWWPRDRGAQHLYDVTVALKKNGVTIDQYTFRHGIRTVALQRTSVTDVQGHGEFCFIVNGERTFIKGTNWVPADAFHSRDLARIPDMIALAEDIGCNMFRCWGGNVYENDLFYDLCDEKGFLVWQDFAMACAIYPQDATFCHRLEEEARKVVRRLRQHPALAIWAGDNECDQCHSWFGMTRDPNYNVLTREVLPAVLRAEDHARPYLPSSPFIDSVAYQQGEAYLPESHLWGPRDYYKSHYYTESLCHFASEIGYHGCPDPDSIRRFISPEKVWPYQDNEEWLLHSTSMPPTREYDYRVELMAKQVRELFGAVPDTLEEFAFASQASQAEAKKFFIEHFRNAKWRRTGIIWWNLIDGWPQFSDAVVDYYYKKKLAYYTIKTAQQPVCLMLREPDNWAQELVAVNDLSHAVTFTYTVRDLDTTDVLAAGETTVAANGIAVLASIPFSMGDKRCYLLEWNGADVNGRNYYLAGNPPFSLEQYRRWFSQLGIIPVRDEEIATGTGV